MKSDEFYKELRAMLKDWKRGRKLSPMFRASICIWQTLIEILRRLEEISDGVGVQSDRPDGSDGSDGSEEDG